MDQYGRLGGMMGAWGYCGKLGDLSDWQPGKGERNNCDLCIVVCCSVSASPTNITLLGVFQSE